ncbi:DUF1761 family protein [Bacillus gobiensis]|uniref:DUF1761 family protein n=1 Tax=Bacillus gobiensis TaxID=1441095 RepID=UPI003D1D4429
MERLMNAQFNTQKYIASALIAFISSFLIALLVQIAGIDTLLSGLGLGLMIGLLAAFVFLKNTLFGLTSTKIYAIAMGEHMISFMLLGMLHALWK